jgi:isocitrate dehydrogenase
VTRHYYKWLKGEKTSTNPVATIYAWSGALRKRGEIDNLPRLVEFADVLENSVIDTIKSGVMTGDLAAMMQGVKGVESTVFLDAIKANMEKMLCKN